MSMKGFTEGRIVHFVLPNSQHRPAMIVNAWELSGVCEGYANLQVFTDGTNDSRAMSGSNIMELGTGRYWATSVCYDENKAPGTWHWIEPA